MIKIKLFNRNNLIKSANDYEEFIKTNKNTKIVSVNIIKNTSIILLYKN